MTNLLSTALDCRGFNLSSIPATEDGEKRPGLSKWKTYQTRLPTVDELKAWFASERTGIGLVTGAVSGNLEFLDFDSHEAFVEFRELAKAAELGDVVERLYLEQTPRGAHLAWRCDTIAGNQKLAFVYERDKHGNILTDEYKNPKMKTLIETRGEGGFIIIAPSGGRVHPTGKPYTLISGSLATIPVITQEERQELFSLARTLGEVKKEQQADRSEPHEPGSNGDRPGDLFNARATWEEVLAPHGWRRVYERGGVSYWRRPGKDRGISASINFQGSGLLYVWSTSTLFESERGYSKFSAYTLLTHAGDFKKAAESLISAGYKNTRTGKNKSPHQLSSLPERESEYLVIPVDKDKIEPFPVEVLPNPLRNWVHAGARAMCCPPDFLAVPALTLAGAAIGKTRLIEIKKGWRESTNIFSAVTASPGSKKSPALAAASAPFRARQQVLYVAYEKKLAEYELALAQYEIDITQWKKASGKGTAAANQKPQPPDEPSLAQVFTTDTTVEAQAPLLKNNPRGVVNLSDELTAWVRSFNQYKSGRGTDRQAWLSFWSGSQVLVNRKTMKPIVLNAPFVAVTGCLPPDVLPDLSDERGREDGFVHRVLFSFPDPVPQQWTEDEIAADILTQYQEFFSALFALQPALTENGEMDPVVLTLSPLAKNEWRAWITAHYEEQTSEKFPIYLKGPWAKLEGYCARLALILHCCREAAGETNSVEIEEQDITAAWALIDYFKSHAKRVYSHLRTTPADRRAEAVTTWMRDHGGQATVRDLVTYRVANIQKSSEAKQLLKDLVDRGSGVFVKRGKREIFTLHSLSTQQLDENLEESECYPLNHVSAATQQFVEISL